MNWRHNFIEKMQRIASLIKLADIWDVIQKAQRLVRDGQVHIVHNRPDYIEAIVQGDHGVYNTQIQRHPGTHALRDAMWNCTCKWAQFAWDRSRRYKYLEGRPCAHAYSAYYKGLATPIDLEGMEEGYKPMPGQRVKPYTPEEMGQQPQPPEAPPEPSEQRTFSPDEMPPNQPEQEPQFQPGQNPAMPPSVAPINPAVPMQPGVPQRQQFNPYDVTAPPYQGVPFPPQNPVSIPGANPPGWQNPTNPTQFPGTFSSWNRESSAPVILQGNGDDPPYEPGWMYHITTDEELPYIREHGLVPFSPDYGTDDQYSWPNGGEEDRVYFGDTTNLYHFSKEGNPIMLRTQRTPEFRRDVATDYYLNRTVQPSDLQIWSENGWEPLQLEKSSYVREAGMNGDLPESLTFQLSNLNTSSPYFEALIDNNIVGYLELYGGHSHYKIYKVFTQPRYRRLGIAKALLSYAIDAWAKPNGYTIAHSSDELTNDGYGWVYGDPDKQDSQGVGRNIMGRLMNIRTKDSGHIPVIIKKSSEFHFSYALEDFYNEMRQQGKKPLVEVVEPVVIEQRGGKIPMPGASPIERNDEGVDVYPMMQMGYDPQTQQRAYADDPNYPNGAPENRGQYTEALPGMRGEILDMENSVFGCQALVSIALHQSPALHPHTLTGWVDCSALKPLPWDTSDPRRFAQ